MRPQFKNLHTWRGKLTAIWLCLAPPAAMVAMVLTGGIPSNRFVVEPDALGQSRQDAVFDDLAGDLRKEPGVDGSVGTEKRSQVEVPFTGTVDGRPEPGIGPLGDARGIPGTVLAAYQRAATALSAAQPDCGMTWPLLAGIGKVESSHASGGRVDATGLTRGRILGPVLDGGPGMASIGDTDDGRYDGDTRWDRAVGPMQFIPGTWAAFGADGNADGVKDPHNVYDAARAAGDYLCSGGADLRNPQGLVRSLLRYNHSMDYVSTVLRWMQAYSRSTVRIPDRDGVVPPPTGDYGNAEKADDPAQGVLPVGDGRFAPRANAEVLAAGPVAPRMIEPQPAGPAQPVPPAQAEPQQQQQPLQQQQQAQPQGSEPLTSLGGAQDPALRRIAPATTPSAVTAPSLAKPAAPATTKPPVLSPVTTTAPATTKPPVTTTAPATTKPPVTTTAPATTPATTKPPVTTTPAPATTTTPAPATTTTTTPAPATTKPAPATTTPAPATTTPDGSAQPVSPPTTAPTTAPSTAPTDAQQACAAPTATPSVIPSPRPTAPTTSLPPSGAPACPAGEDSPDSDDGRTASTPQAVLKPGPRSEGSGRRRRDGVPAS